MSQNQGHSNRSNITLIVGCSSAVAIIIAAIIGLGAPFAERAADFYFPTLTSIPNSSPILTSSPNELPTQFVEPTLHQPSINCQEVGGASGFALPPNPQAPTGSCVLIIEWWVPPDTNNCGILITSKEPNIPDNSIGSWWYVYPQRPDSHKQEFLTKNPHCKVEDLR
jgi:hypothetical protein